MRIDFYTAFQVTKLASTVIVAIFGLCLFALAVPHDDVLRNYRACRKFLGTAYWIFASMNFLGYFFRHCFPNIDHSYVNAHLTLIVASYQTIFLPRALVTLINADCLDRKKIRLSLILVSMLSFLSIASFFSPFPDWLTTVIFLIFLAYYSWQLVTSTRLIIAESRSAGERMDDYFSNPGTLHIGWIRIMGIISNSCGVLSLLMVLVRSWGVAFFVLLYISVAYVILAIK
jgi:hypothetical protein